MDRSQLSDFALAGGRFVILVAGVAGFIGYHVARRLLDRKDLVIGLDNLNDYYDVRLKLARLGSTHVV